MTMLTPFLPATRRAVRLLFLLGLLLPLFLAPPARAAQGPVVTEILSTDTDLEEGEYLWEPTRSVSGRLEIVADVARDRLYVYRGGVEIGRTILIYGNDDKPTPLGSFKILQKKRDHISNIYGAPMPFMMRLTWTGIALHGSGDTVDNRYATHGCIGLPDEFAALLFRAAKLGDRVTVTRNWLPQFYS
ncbi:L,D-transpeptidase family protein [Sphingomonas sp. IC-56]|uniref:L,D-transpeptidase family protein n=1 Tax=Sphingomonas sp. IC-56 TaxID=2898529 RepID=UPI001E3D3022|nr:L,D-transpeptidase family protein [Sphingomonas sp. IC-56]MCD2322444.1 L,D-transpeptidase family protein [Sphingomonas sp. IC-56]